MAAVAGSSFEAWRRMGCTLIAIILDVENLSNQRGNHSADLILQFEEGLVEIEPIHMKEGGHMHWRERDGGPQMTILGLS